MKNYFHVFFLCQFILTNLMGQGEISIDFSKRFQSMDGFGAFQGGDLTTQSWWQDLYINDMACSIYRVDLTPRLKSPFSDLSYYSPWFMGSQVKSVFNLEDPANPNGPENNRIRTYAGPTDYSRTFGGRTAPIAVMGPNIESNLNYFQYPVDSAIKKLLQKKNELGDVKIIASIWSPLPWLKVSSGNTYNQNWWPGPIAGSKWPFIWGGNFAGGRLDVSRIKCNEFNDISQGGVGNTDAITQFVRSTATYILGYQRNFNFKFYAISLQNELNFEEYYNSMTYPLSSQYIIALKELRKEFNSIPELKNIRIMGPEDLMGGDSYGMWEYGGPVHKNLQYLSNIAKDPEALAALDFVCIHGYANDGISSAGSNPILWDWWVNGWINSPAAGIPANIKGFKALNKKSWMTESSGENRDWLFPKNSYPNSGAWSIALKLQQALTTGNQSAWLYWTFADSNNDGTVSDYGLTNMTQNLNSPKYIAAKHFFKFIRPNSIRVNTISTTDPTILSSAFYNDSTKNLCVEILNTSSTSKNIQLTIPGKRNAFNLTEYTSSESNYFISNDLIFNSVSVNLTLPAYSIKTINGVLPLITNVDEEVSNSLNMFWNKSESRIYFQSADNFSKAKSIKIYQLNGNLLYEKNLNPNSQNFIDLKSISILPAYYLIVVNSFYDKQNQLLFLE